MSKHHATPPPPPPLLLLLLLLLFFFFSQAAMINAVLVFNNTGQPRLTKFYTQLVRPRTHDPLPRRQALI